MFKSATPLNKLSDEALSQMKEKLSTQLVEVECEIQKRKKTADFQRNLSTELEKIKEQGINEIVKIQASKTKPSEKKTPLRQLNTTGWTIPLMQKLLKRKKIEYKKSMNKGEYIAFIQENSLVKEMNELVK